MAILNFNADDVEPLDFSPLPVGDYKMAVTASTINETKSNPDNKYLKLTFEVIEGKYKGRKVFENLNLWRAGNSERDEITVRIAQQNLSSLCRALGITKLGDSSALHGKPVIVSLKINPATEYYGESNSVRAYKPLNGGGGGYSEHAAAPAAQDSSSEQAPHVMPWDNV